MNLHIWWEDLTIQLIRLCFHRFQNILCLLPTQHQNYTFHRVVIFLITKLAQPRGVSNGYVSDIAHAYGHTFIGADDDVSNVVRVTHKANATNVVELSALRIEAPASIGVIGAHRCDDLRNREVVSKYACWIEQHLILHHRTAKTRVVGNTVHGAICSCHDPVPNCLHLLGCAIGAFKNVAVYQTTWAE